MQLAARTCLNLCVPYTIEFQSSRSLPTNLTAKGTLSRLGGKYRQLAHQVGDSASSSVNSMAGSSDANNLPKGTTLVFGSWACTADRSGGFSSHLVTPNLPKPKTTSQSAGVCKIAELDGKQAPSELSLNIPENVSTP